MDFDPGFHEEMYEEGYEDAQEEETEPIEDEVEYDALGNPIYLAAAAGFGYHMAEEDLEERKLAEDILNRKDQKKTETIKVPLATRHGEKDKRKPYVTPFGRWATKVNQDPTKADEPIQYTMEEQLRIIEAQGKGHD